MKVIGIQRSVTFKVEGNTFSGMNIYVSTPRDGVDGVATEKLFINSSKECFPQVAGLKVGDDINVYYNRYGKVDTIVLNK